MLCVCTSMYPYDRLYLVPEMHVHEGKIVILEYLCKSDATDDMCHLPLLQFIMIPKGLAFSVQSVQIQYFEATTNLPPDLEKNSLFWEYDPFTQREWFDGETLIPENEPYRVIN